MAERSPPVIEGLGRRRHDSEPEKERQITPWGDEGGFFGVPRRRELLEVSSSMALLYSCYFMIFGLYSILFVGTCTCFGRYLERLYVEYDQPT